MVYKSCIYKGCDNYTCDFVPCGNKQFTIFRFPKDPRRYEQWMIRGRVPDGLPETQMLMCSDHFDEKYLIKNPRRTILTTTAIPFPYCEENDIEGDKECEDGIVKVDDTLDTEMVFSIQEDLNGGSALIRLRESLRDGSDVDEMVEIEKVENNSDAEYCVESTTMKDELNEELGNLGDEFKLTSDYEAEILSDMVTQSAPKESAAKCLKIYAAKKRKIDSDVDENQEPSSSKMLASKMSSTQSGKNDMSGTGSKHNVKQDHEANNKPTKCHQKENTPEADSDYNIDAETLVDAKVVRCFIFKGEEYVQMPKDYYVQEKLKLMEKLASYENCLGSFKKKLENLDLP